MLFVKPTSRGWVALALAVGSSLVMLVNPGFVIAAFTALVWAVLAVSLMSSLFSLQRVSLVREPGSDCRRGSMVNLPVRIRNHSRRARQAMVVVEKCGFAAEKESCHIVPPLGRYESRRLRRPVFAARRGEYEMDKVVLRGGDPAGLFTRQRTFRLPQMLLVQPEIMNVVYLPLQLRHRSRMSVTGSPIGTSGMGQDFYGIREYKPTDGIRFIDWKATARQSKLMVREFEENAIHQVSVFLDTDGRHQSKAGDPNNFELLVNVAASLVDYLSGMHCRLLFSCGALEEGRQVAGPAQTVREETMHLLTVIQPDKLDVVSQIDNALDRIGPDSIVYCLTMHEPEGLAGAFEVLMGQGVVVRWLHAPRTLFETAEVEQQAAMVQRYVADSDRLVMPVILSPESDIPQLLQQTR